jgi:DNA-binding LacI/PurR family transcriptional regulator
MTRDTQMRRKVTINTVAESAQVSRQTVTNALLHPERVHPETLERVRSEIDRLGYRPSAAATSLRSQRAGAVGVELNVLGPAYHNAMMAPFLAALSSGARDYDVHIVTFGSADSAPTLEAYQQMWERQVVDAFVIADTHPGDPRATWLADKGIAFASFGRVWDDPTFTRWVDVDGYHGTSVAVEHCATQGYARVGFLGAPEGTSVVGDARRDGWLDGVRRHGLAGVPQARFAPDELDRAVVAAAEVVADVGRGGAVVCASDVLALAVLHAVWRAGLRPGVDVGIVGFDDSELARMHGLTSLAQPMQQIGDHVLRLVSESLSGVPDARDRGGVLLHPTLKPRSSTHQSSTPGRST